MTVRVEGPVDRLSDSQRAAIQTIVGFAEIFEYRAVEFGPVDEGHGEIEQIVMATKNDGAEQMWILHIDGDLTSLDTTIA